MKYSITKNGKPLDKKLYTIDEKAKMFSTEESGLVLDFSGLGGWSFKTNWNCTFNTGSDCTFNTDSSCTFDTGSRCTFKTGSRCVVIRRDIYEVIELKADVKIKLNGYIVKGYTVIEDEKAEQKPTIKIGDLEFDKEEVEERLKDLKPL